LLNEPLGSPFEQVLKTLLKKVLNLTWDSFNFFVGYIWKCGAPAGTLRFSKMNFYACVGIFCNPTCFSNQIHPSPASFCFFFGKNVGQLIHWKEYHKTVFSRRHVK
jgi:hypothetical protein